MTSFRLATFYGLYYLTVGVALPFLPAYFQSLGLTSAQSGVLLSAGPVFSLLMPPVWGQVADRSGRPGLVLLVLCVGGLSGYAALLGASTFGTALLAMGVYSIFGPSITTIADALSLAHIENHGGTFAHLRRWGSLGFVVATVGFGTCVTRVDRTAVLAPLVGLATSALWCAVYLARAPKVPLHGPRPTARAAATLLRNPPLRLLLLATMLHWVAGTPFHGSLSPHFTSLGLAPWAVGLTWGVAVGSEVLVLSLWPRWSQRLKPRTLLLATFSLGALRWWGMAATNQVVALTLLASLHGLTFGAFYVTAVGQVARLAPDSLRATGQSLFASVTFGLGGLIGFTGSGVLYDLMGGHRLFALAGVLELVPIVALGWWGNERTQQGYAPVRPKRSDM